jgi:hypothetical protein
VKWSFYLERTVHWFAIYGLTNEAPHRSAPLRQIHDLVVVIVECLHVVRRDENALHGAELFAKVVAGLRSATHFFLQACKFALILQGLRQESRNIWYY